MITSAEKAFGRVDILVNNAAVFKTHDFINDPLLDWMQVLEVNLLGAVRCARAAATRMVEAGKGGRIINVSSVHGFLAENHSSHYDVAKGGIGSTDADSSRRACAARHSRQRRLPRVCRYGDGRRQRRQRA